MFRRGGVDLIEAATETKQCDLLGPFALYVQGALGLLALLSLVYKRYRERPQRPLKIWFFDASKQVVGSVLVHIANLLLAYMSSRPQEHKPGDPSSDDSNYEPNPCSFYLLNLLIDTTLGIFILVFFLRVTTALCRLLPDSYAFSHGIESGNYGRPPKARNWLKQSAIYFVGLMGMKTVVWIMFEVMPWLGRFGDWLLGWTEGNRKVQIAFVMFIFPLIMNAMQYYIIDTFIKMKEGSPHLSDSDISGDEEDLSGSEILDRDSNIPQVQPSANAGNVGLYSDDEDDEDRGLLDPSKKVNSKPSTKRSRKRSKSPSLRPSKRKDGSNTDGESVVGSAAEDAEQGKAYKLKSKRDDDGDL